jgi:hypothetical protein
MQFCSVEISSSVASDVGTSGFGVPIFVNLPLDLHLQLPTTLKLPTALSPLFDIMTAAVCVTINMAISLPLPLCGLLLHTPNSFPSDIFGIPFHMLLTFIFYFHCVASMNLTHFHDQQLAFSTDNSTNRYRLLTPAAAFSSPGCTFQGNSVVYGAL